MPESINKIIIDTRNSGRLELIPADEKLLKPYGYEPTAVMDGFFSVIVGSTPSKLTIFSFPITEIYSVETTVSLC